MPADVETALQQIVNISVFALILLFASVSDVKSRMVKDEYTVMLPILAATQITCTGFINGLLGALFSSFPFIMTVLVSNKERLGGADVKIAFGIGAVLGLEKGLVAMMIGMILAVIIEGCKAHKKKNKEKSGEGFPLIPYLAIPAVIMAAL